jgi:hypothetical protein
MFGRKLYESGVHLDSGRNEIDFGKVTNSSKSRLCGTLRRPGPCHQSILSEFHRRSEPKESARNQDGIASGSDVGNFRNQTMGRNPPRERTGIRGPRSGKVAQSDSIRDVANCQLAHLTNSYRLYHHKAEMKDLQGNTFAAIIE